MDTLETPGLLSAISLILRLRSGLDEAEDPEAEKATKTESIKRIRKGLGQFQTIKKEEVTQVLKKTFIEACNICLGEIFVQDNLMCRNWSKLFCKDWLLTSLKRSPQWPNCRENIKLSQISENRSYKKMTEAIEMLERKDKALIYWNTHSEATKMFCKDWDIVVCQTWILEETHLNHKITNLPEHFENLKHEIDDWKEQVNNLYSFGTAKVDELNKLMSPSVEQLFGFRNALLKDIRDELDSIIDKHRQVLPGINEVCKKANEFTRCLAQQQYSLDEKSKLSCNTQSYNELKDYVASIKNTEGNLHEGGGYRAEVKEYLTLPEDQQSQLEAKFTSDLTVDPSLLQLRWPSTEDLLQKLQKLQEVMKKTTEAYLQFGK